MGNLVENTDATAIFTADHGESMGELGGLATDRVAPSSRETSLVGPGQQEGQKRTGD